MTRETLDFLLIQSKNINESCQNFIQTLVKEFNDLQELSREVSELESPLYAMFHYGPLKDRMRALSKLENDYMSVGEYPWIFDVKDLIRMSISVSIPQVMHKLINFLIQSLKKSDFVQILQVKNSIDSDSLFRDIKIVFV